MAEVNVLGQKRVGRAVRAVESEGVEQAKMWLRRHETTDEGKAGNVAMAVAVLTSADARAECLRGQAE